MEDFLTNENYNLSYYYNEDIVTLMVRDPYCLFTYWEVSTPKIKNFINQFGQSAWDNSKLVLKVNNISNHEVTYIEVYHTCGSWYINSVSPDCTYTVEVGKLFENNIFVSLISSNSTNTPRDKESSVRNVYFAEYSSLKKLPNLNQERSLENYTKKYYEQIGFSSSELYNKKG